MLRLGTRYGDLRGRGGKGGAKRRVGGVGVLCGTASGGGRSKLPPPLYVVVLRFFTNNPSA